MCNSYVIGQYQPSDMYIYLHMIGLVIHIFISFYRQISADFIDRFLVEYGCVETNIFGKSSESSSGLFVPSFRFFQHLKDMKT